MPFLLKRLLLSGEEDDEAIRKGGQMIPLVLLSWRGLGIILEGAERGVACGVDELAMEVDVWKESVDAETPDRSSDELPLLLFLRATSDACSGLSFCLLVSSGCEGLGLLLLLHDKGLRSATVITDVKRSGGSCTAWTFSSAELNAFASGSVAYPEGKSGGVWKAVDWFPFVLTLSPPRESLRSSSLLLLLLKLESE